MENWFVIVNDCIHIKLKAFPGSSKNEFSGVRDGRLCVRIAASPENGKANTCLRDFIAKSAGCAKKDVAVIKGNKSKLKTVSIPALYKKNLTEKIMETGLTNDKNAE